MVSIVILWLDVKVEINLLFYLHVAPKNIHSFMRFDHLINRLFHSESITSPLYNQFISNSKILHALGLLHEHQRPDRDCYIDVDMVAARKYGFDNQLKKASFLKNQKLRNRGFFFSKFRKIFVLKRLRISRV